jgi:hypothetical protein
MSAELLAWYCGIGFLIVSSVTFLCHLGWRWITKLIRTLSAVAVITFLSGCACVYSTGRRADDSSWRLFYASFIWDKDFKGVDLAKGRAESLASKPDADATKAVAEGIVEGLK